MRLINAGTAAFFGYFLRAYPARTSWMILLLAISGVLEGVSVIALVPLLETAAAPQAGGATSGVSQLLAGWLGAVGLTPTLYVLTAVVVLGITCKAILLWLAMREVGFTVARVTLDLRLQLLRALLRARWSYFGKQPIGRYANSISSEAVLASSAYQEACSILAGGLQVVVYLGISALISWEVTLAALITGVLFIRLLRRFMGMGRAAGEDQTRLTRNLATRLVDALQGLKPMKAMAREDLFLPLLEREANGLNEAHKRFVVASQSLKLFQEPIVTLVLGVGLVFMFTLTERSFSSVVVLAFVFYRLMTHINTLQMRYQIMTKNESGFWSLREQIDDAQSAVELHQGQTIPRGLSDAIELRHVHFSYDELAVLHDINIRIPAGQITALVGASGSGKTTIIDLIAGLQRPLAGDVFVDGTPLEQIDLFAWRSLIGYVPQNVLVFQDTVRRNVTLGDDSISDERVLQALKNAGAVDFIARDSRGLDAMIAPQGSNYSGGQLQRLAIARALARNPALLILDEATTGLDAETEAAILDTLKTLRGKVTILAISHQPAIRGTADTTLELVSGSISARIPVSPGAPARAL